MEHSPNMNYKVQEYLEIMRDHGFDWLTFERTLSHAYTFVQKMNFDQYMQILKVFAVHASSLNNNQLKRWQKKVFSLGEDFGFLEQINSNDPVLVGVPA